MTACQKFIWTFSGTNLSLSNRNFPLDFISKTDKRGMLMLRCLRLFAELISNTELGYLRSALSLMLDHICMKFHVDI